MGLIRAVGVNVMGPRRTASVLKRGMRLLTKLVLVPADRERLKRGSWSIEASEAYAEFQCPKSSLVGDLRPKFWAETLFRYGDGGVREVLCIVK